MNNRIILLFLVALVASHIKVRASDTPEQAAARVALEQKLKELDNPQSQPAWNTPPPAGLAKPGEAATKRTDSVPAKMVDLHLVPTAATPAAAPAVVFLATNAAPAKAAPTAAVASLKPAPVQAKIKPPVRVMRPRPTNEIATIHGTIYKNAEVERVESDGIIISYWTAAGGLGMSKVYFEDLPANLRLQYKPK